MRSEQAPFFVKHDFSSRLIVLLQERVMLLCKHIRHQQRAILSNDLLTVPPEAFLEAVRDFQHAAARILVTRDVNDHCLITEQHIALMSIIIIGPVVCPDTTMSSVTLIVATIVGLHHDPSEICFVSFIEILLAKFNIVSYDTLVLCVHDQSLRVVRVDLAEL